MPGSRYINVILPLRLDWEPCYSLPESDASGSAVLQASSAAQQVRVGNGSAAPQVGNGSATPQVNADSTALQIRVGSRVRVRFAGRLYTAVVSAVDIVPDIDPSRIGSVEECDTGLEPVSREELEFWRFIADYYCCTVGEVYKAAYPLPKTKSEEIHVRTAKRRERLLEKEKELWQKRIAKLTERLLAKDRALAGRHGAAVLERLRTERAGIAAELAEAQKRLDALNGSLFAELPKAVRLSSGTSGLELMRPFSGTSDTEAMRLSSDTSGAEFSAASTLLAEVTGKRTEGLPAKPILFKSVSRIGTYCSLAAGVLQKGRSVLFLVPEINLAKKLREELADTFGDLLSVHHSEETTARRRKISDTVRSDNPCIVLGTRSSIFLPFKDLGLIIVDSEQSAFYKQAEPAPRYNARDAAVMLAKIHGAPVVLGSSSPSLESLFNASSGRYSLIDVTSSAQSDSSATSAQSVPEHKMTDVHKNSIEGCFSSGMEIIDTKAERRKNGMLGCLSRRLIAECRALPDGSCAPHEGNSAPDGRMAFIRGYEKAEDLEQNLQETVPELRARIDVFTIPEASRTDLSAYGLIAMLSADALFVPEDFRSDEHAFQFLDSLRCECGKVIVQTANPAHQVFSLSSAEPLLAERKAFSLPPYTRLADILLPDCERFGDVHSAFARKLARMGFNATDALPRPDGRSLIRVTLPRDRQLQANKKALYSAVQAFRTEHKLRTGVIIDVDPL